AAVGLAAGVAWADSARSGLVTPWAMVAFFWGAALVSVSIRYLAYYLAEGPPAPKRYWLSQGGRAWRQTLEGSGTRLGPTPSPSSGSRQSYRGSPWWRATSVGLPPAAQGPWS